MLFLKLIGEVRNKRFNYILLIFYKCVNDLKYGCLTLISRPYFAHGCYLGLLLRRSVLETELSHNKNMRHAK